MKLMDENYGTATRSGFVAPTLGAVKAGVCPQAGFRRVDGHALEIFQAMSLTAGAAGTAWGRTSWSPLIT